MIFFKKEKLNVYLMMKKLSMSFIDVRCVHLRRSHRAVPRSVHDADGCSHAVIYLSFVCDECVATVVIHCCMDVGGCC